MSIYNSQEYTDAWDDMPSSLQEQLLQDVALLESGTVLTSTATDQPLLSHVRDVPILTCHTYINNVVWYIGYTKHQKAKTIP